MRTISVSTDVFARIWALREEGEETEEDILRRLLQVSVSSPADNVEDATPSTSGDGFHDHANQVHFPEGFEIFRVYKGIEYRARATRGRWLLLNDKQFYPSLHKLSTAVVAGNENSWRNWKFDAGNGRIVFIDNLRNAAVISKRV